MKTFTFESPDPLRELEQMAREREAAANVRGWNSGIAFMACFALLISSLVGLGSYQSGVRSGKAEAERLSGPIGDPPPTLTPIPSVRGVVPPPAPPIPAGPPPKE